MKSISLFRPSFEHIRKKVVIFPFKVKFNLGISPTSISSLSLVKSISSFIFSSFCILFLVLFQNLHYQELLVFFGRLKIIFSSGTISSFGFSFSMTLLSSPIRRSPLIDCIVFCSDVWWGYGCCWSVWDKNFLQIP